jgi:hypothetical protein
MRFSWWYRLWKLKFLIKFGVVRYYQVVVRRHEIAE